MKKLSQLVSRNWLISLVILFAAFWRLPLLTGSFWLDEAAQALESARPLSQQLQIRDDFQPPLLHLLVHFELMISRSEIWLRLWAAVLPGLLTIWLAYKIGEKLFDKKTGVLAAILLSTSSFHVFYSQELRPYSMPAFLGALSWYSLVLLFDQKKTNIKLLILFFISTAAGLYTSYLYPFLLLSQIGYVLCFQPKWRKEVLGAVTASSLTFLPWIPSFFGQLQAGQSLRQDLPGWQDVVSFNQLKSILLIFGKFSFGVLDLQTSLFFGLVTLIIVGASLFLMLPYFKSLKSAEMKPVFLILFWFVVPVVLAWLVSFVVPVLQPKRVLYSLPAFYLLLSWLIGRSFFSNTRTTRFVGITLAITLLITNFYSSISYFSNPKYQREDWKGMHAAILKKYPGPLSAAAFAFPAPFAPWQWYDDGKYPTYATGLLTTSSQEELPNAKELTKYRFILVFDYLRDLTDPQNKVLTQLQQYGYHEVDHLTPATPLGFVRVYAKSTDVIGLLR